MQVVLGTILLLVLTANVSLAAKNKKTEKESGIKAQKTDSKTLFDDGKKVNVNELRGTIQGLNILIQQAKSSKSKNRLSLQKIYKKLDIAKYYRVQERDDKQAKFFLRSTLKDCYALEEIAKDKKVKAQALFACGLASVFLGQRSSAYLNFEKSIKTFPQLKVAPVVSLYLGESSFEDSKWSQAIRYYKLYFKQLSRQQKSLAYYKMAWSYVNLEKFSTAEKFFIRVLKQGAKSQFASDVVRDLAFVISLSKEEPQIITFADKYFANKKGSYYKFLDYSYSTLIKKGKTKIDSPIFDKLLAYKKKNDEKIDLYIKKMGAMRKDFASINHLKVYINLRKFIKKNKINVLELEKDIKNDLQSEIERLLGSYSETYAEKVKTPEKLSKETVKKNTIYIAQTYLTDFPFKKKKEVYGFTLGLCEKYKKYKCLYSLSKITIKEVSDLKVIEVAKLNEVVSLEKLSKKDQKLKEKYMNKITLFYSEEENHPKWGELAKKYAKILLEDKRYEEVLPVFEKIYSKNQDPEILYQIQVVKLELGMNEEIKTTQFSSKIPAEWASKIRKIKSEASLRSAKKSIDSGDFKSYESDIIAFVDNTNDKSKVNIALRDYMARLLDMKNFEKARKEMISRVSPEERRSKMFKDITYKIYEHLYFSGNFKKCSQLLAYKGPNKDAFSYQKEICNVSLIDSAKKVFLNKRLRNFNKNEAEYMLGTTAVVYPSVASSFLEKRKDLKDMERNLLLLSYQLDEGVEDIKYTKSRKKKLGKLFPENSVPTKLTLAEKRYKKIRFPTKKMKTKTFLKRLELALDKTRQNRSHVVKSTKGQILKVQRRVLEQAVDIEKKVGQLMRDSPTPKGLAKEDVKKYKAAILEASSEFDKQASEFQVLLDKVNEKDKEFQAEREQYLFEVADFSKAKGVSDKKKYKIIKSHVIKNRWLGAIILLDGWKTAGMIRDRDYYKMRSAILLMRHQNYIMGKFISNELKADKALELLKDGKKALNHYTLFIYGFTFLGSGKKGKKAKVLDFEADIIEGERKDPNLFLQLDLSDDNIDSAYSKGIILMTSTKKMQRFVRDIIGKR